MELITPHNEFNFNLNKLDPTQHQVVVSEAENILLRAPAGSGKTSVLLSAVAQYRYDHLNDKICAITYTRAAREEMEHRLSEMGIHDVQVTTIHVWARTLLQEFAFKYNFKIRILTEGEIKSILQEIINEYLKNNSRIRNVKVDILYSFIMGNKNMDVSDNYKRTLCALDARYIRYKREQILYDFTDYPLYLFNVLNTFDESINNIDALFVDEYQDVDEIQYELFKKVNSSKKFFVGDQWQSIYAFRGADGEVFQKTTDFEQYKLKYNYRSYQEIINYATTVYQTLTTKAQLGDGCYISEVMYSYDSDISCARGKGGEITVINPYGRCMRLDQNGIGRISNIIDVFKDFISERAMILCRTNKQVKAINDGGYYETSTVHQAKGLEYDNVIVIDTTITSTEDLNIAYVAMTRAKNRLMVINWTQFEMLFNICVR